MLFGIQVVIRMAFLPEDDVAQAESRYPSPVQLQLESLI